MSKMKVSVPHNLTIDDAKQRLENFIGILKQEYGSNLDNVKEDWNGNQGTFSFKAMGMPIEGNIYVESREVNIEGNLPMAAIPFKGKIESTIQDQLRTLLS